MKKAQFATSFAQAKKQKYLTAVFLEPAVVTSQGVKESKNTKNSGSTSCWGSECEATYCPSTDIFMKVYSGRCYITSAAFSAVLTKDVAKFSLQRRLKGTVARPASNFCLRRQFSSATGVVGTARFCLSQVSCYWPQSNLTIIEVMSL